MTKAVIFCTNWSPNYWNHHTEAPYDFPEYLQTLLNNIRELPLPIPAIGIYKEGRNGDFSNRPFQFMKITGMSEEGERVYFSIEPIQSDNVVASSMFNRRTNILAEVQESDFISANLSNLEVIPPIEWSELLENIHQPVIPQDEWKNWIGDYFKRLYSNNIGNNEFEDIVADVFRAIGFEVEQLGYNNPGERVSDGVLTGLDIGFAIIYDCKNQNNYYPRADDERAMREYVEREQIRLKENEPNLKVYGLFIAKKLSDNWPQEMSGFSVDNLLYLLYKRLKLGISFSLMPFEEACKHHRIDKKWIDEKYPENHR